MSTTPAVRIERTMDAPRSRVYRAWLDPDVAARWMAPTPFHPTRAEIDPRAGGFLRVWHGDHSGARVGGLIAEIVDLVPDERLEFAWRFGDPDDPAAATPSSRLVVSLADDKQGRTRLTLVHDELDAMAEQAPQVVAGVRDGWTSALDRLDVMTVLADPLAEELLTADLLTRVAYTGLDGGPRVVPLAVHWTGTEIVFGTIPDSAKVAALQADPRIALTIDTAGMPPKVLLVRGTATLETVDGIPEEYLAASRKQVPDEDWTEWEAGVRGLYDRMTLVRIQPTWAKVMDFQTRAPEAVERLARRKLGAAAG